MAKRAGIAYLHLQSYKHTTARLGIVIGLLQTGKVALLLAREVERQLLLHGAVQRVQLGAVLAQKLPRLGKRNSRQLVACASVERMINNRT